MQENVTSLSKGMNNIVTAANATTTITNVDAVLTKVDAINPGLGRNRCGNEPPDPWL